MPKIANWTLVTERNVADVDYLMAGVVRKWEHDHTGEAISIHWTTKESGGVFYNIKYHGPEDPNGEAVTAGSTLTEALESVRETLEGCPEGLGRADEQETEVAA